MKIEVRLFATFRNGRFKNKTMEFSSDITPREILEKLEIEIKDVAILLVNGIHNKVDITLSDGDSVSLFPPVGGG